MGREVEPGDTMLEGRTKERAGKDKCSLTYGRIAIFMYWADTDRTFVRSPESVFGGREAEIGNGTANSCDKAAKDGGRAK